MSYGVGKKDNAYARMVLHVDAPKTVWMALAVSFAAMTVESAEELLEDRARLEGVMLAEWQTLHDNGLVPQKPRRS
jgi:hypothetical protein